MRGLPIFDSVIEPRIHDQLIYNDADVCGIEQTSKPVNVTLSQRTKDALIKRHHRLIPMGYAGCVQAISIDIETGHISAVSDIRKGGKPAGY